MKTANRHTYPHWPDLEEHMVLRLPGDLYDMIVDEADVLAITPAEAARRHLWHAYTGQRL